MSERGRFSVDFSQGCIPYEIKVTDLFDPAASKSWFILYEGETEDTEITPQPGEPVIFTVTKPKKLTIIQWSQGYTPLEDRLVVAGYDAVNPTFTTYTCSNLGGVVTIQNPNYDFYEVRFGTNPALVTVDANTNFTAEGNFLTAGENAVTVRGFYKNAPNNCAESSSTLTAHPQLPKPIWKGLQWDQLQSTVQLQYSLDPNIRYQLDVLDPGTGMYKRLSSLSSTSTDTTFSYPNLASQFACFRITALDDCNGNAVSSDPICTASWSVTAQDGYNQIVYQTSPAFIGTAVLQRADGEVLQNTGASGTFQDSNIMCRQEYCYELLLVPADASLPKATSSAQCVEAISTKPLPPFRNLVSYWRSNQELVVFPHFSSTPYVLNLILQDDGGKKIAAAKGNELSYSTSPSDACYFLTYTNECAPQAATPTQFCPLFLQNKAATADAFVASWNAYTGYEQGVKEYVLQEVNAEGQTIQSWFVGSDTFYDGFDTFTQEDNGRMFQVVALPLDETLAPSLSNIFEYELIMKGYFPNAFSPNGDGLNDEFKILGTFVEQASLWIYNRWGELLFHSADKEVGWSGTRAGDLLPEGTYVYKANVTTRDGKQETVSGILFLKR